MRERTSLTPPPIPKALERGQEVSPQRLRGRFRGGFFSYILLCVLFLIVIPTTAQDTQNVTVPSFDVTVADTTSESGDKPYGMLIDVPEDVELATIVINGIALDLTGGTVILWRDDIVTDTSTLGAGEDDFDTNRRPASWSMSVTKGLVKMRVVDPELQEQLGEQEIVVTAGAALSYDEEAVAEGEQIFDIEPFKAEDIDELQSVISAVDEDAELKVLSDAQVKVVKDSQELLQSIDNLKDVKTAADLIIDNASDDTNEDNFFEFDGVDSDTLGGDQNHLIQFLIENGDLTPEELGALAKSNPQIGELIMNSILYADGSIESLSVLAQTNPEMFAFFVDIASVDDRAVDYFLEISAGNEGFVDEWEAYIAEDPAFADLFLARFDNPAASYALAGLAGESTYINELMLDMAIYDPLFAEELAYVWETNPASARFFFDTVMLDDDAMLNAQFIFSQNIDAFDPIVDGWASDATLGFSDFYDDFGTDGLFTGYDIDYYFGASIVSCIPLGNGSTDIEIAFINAPADVAEMELFGNGSRTVAYEDYLAITVRNSILPIYSIDAYDANGNWLDTAFVDDYVGCGTGNGNYSDPFFDDGYDDLFYDEFSDPAQFGGSTFADTGLFGMEIIGCYPNGAGTTTIDMSVHNLPQNADDFWIYSSLDVLIVPADGFVSIDVPDGELPLTFAEAHDANGDYIDFAYFEGIPCDGDGSDPFENVAQSRTTGIFSSEIVGCYPDGFGSTTIDISVDNLPTTAQSFYVYTMGDYQVIPADEFISLTVADTELPLNWLEAYDSNSNYVDFAYFDGLSCDASGSDTTLSDPAGEQLGGFTAEIVDCAVVDDFSTSVTLILSNVPDVATDMVVYTQTGAISVYPDTTTFLTIDNSDLPITYIEVGNGVETFDGNSPTGLPCGGGDIQQGDADSDFDGYTDDADFCPFEGDNGNGVDELGCPLQVDTDSDFDGFTDDVDFCPFEGDNGDGIDEFGCPLVADSDFDGYTDDIDTCPFEGDNGNGVDEFGCPIAVDSDSDGYTDDVDFCPFEGDNGNGVDEFGCPLVADSDFDGYTDDIDACPFDGDQGTGVDSSGCPNSAEFAVAIIGCESNGAGATNVTFALSNIPQDAAYILFYHNSAGVSGGVQSTVTILTDDVDLPYGRVDVERDTSPFLIADAIPTGSCPQ